jgi:DNA modification methylase
VPPATAQAARKPHRNGTSAPDAAAPLKPDYSILDPDCRVYVGDCREVLPRIPEAAKGKVDLIFADPPFNWNRAYDRWDDAMPEDEYLAFTYKWIDLCVGALTPTGSMWINIPDDWAAEIVVHLKKKMSLVNWCIWHYRFGQNATERFINSKVHALYFAKNAASRTWNPLEILEPSDRLTTYFDPRTESKRDGMPAGHRVPLDVWYGKYWGRIQGNNAERRHGHDNQLPEVYLERVISACSNKGDLVMDPFLGSGTTGVIAHALKRRFIGVEYSPENAQRAFERIEKGPIRLGALKGVGSAIHPPRRVGAKTRKRLESKGD